MTAILPDFRGQPIEVLYRAGLLDTAGNAAHAATWIPRRLIVLEEALRETPREHDRILLHELFHFVWVRLGNPRRLRWEELLRRELAARARGEAGWSAEWRKRALTARDVGSRTRRWREYCCESFCDTAAWRWSGEESEVTLARGRCRKRDDWFARELATRWLAI
ncbi:MAG: hypothetical protein ABUS49_10890 [Acidobacteriota bacterium]